MSWSERINWIETQRGVGAAEEVEETNVKCLDAPHFSPPHESRAGRSGFDAQGFVAECAVDCAW
jgi:hypothetical protein